MFPIICKIGPISIYSYGLMLVLAFFISSALAVKEARTQEIAPEPVFNFLFGVFISGILGSRIFYIIENMGYYFRNPLEIIMFQHGGLSWFGGLILGALYGAVYLKKKKIGILRTLDLVVPYLALGQAIGRIGCLLNGCCYGSGPVPVQIYSSLAMLVIFALLRFIQRIRAPAGRVFFAYPFLYSLKRFFIEFLRDDNPRIFAGLTLFQIISIGMFLGVIAGYAAIYFASRRHKFP